MKTIIRFFQIIFNFLFRATGVKAVAEFVEEKYFAPKEIVGRKFLGKLDNFDSKEDRNFNKKMLKAYLAGDAEFYYGWKKDKKGKKIHVLHTTKQKYIYNTAVQL